MTDWIESYMNGIQFNVTSYMARHPPTGRVSVEGMDNAIDFEDVQYTKALIRRIWLEGHVPEVIEVTYRVLE